MKRQITKRKKILKTTIFIVLITIYLFASFFTLFYFGLFSNFSSTKFDKSKLTYSSTQAVIYDNKNEQILQKLNHQKNVSFSEIPQHVLDAFVSIEDKSFYKHKGINYKRILKATLKNLKSHSFKEGASTISQQLIKNTHLTNEKTLKRKINELLLTQQLERTMSKEEILTSYLNAIYFGSGAFGINTASQRFFSKDVSNLNLEESATLAGIIKSPKLYSPISQPTNCLKRRNLVLSEMLKENKITKEEYLSSTKKPLNLSINSNFLGNNSYYSACVDEACEILGITEKDLILNEYKLYTYQDTNLQEKVEEEIKGYKKYTNNTNCDSLAIVVDNLTGGIKAFYGKSEYNLLNLYRQPGSTFKPIISYGPALENNIITPLTPILDEEININGYKPTNYNKKYSGWIDAKEALAKSLNIPAIKVLQYVGIDKAKQFATNLGITFEEDDQGESIALGGLTKGVKFLELTNCYQSIANDGKQNKLGFIKEIKTKNGQTIYKHSEKSKQVMKDSTSYLLTDMLKNSIENGTSKKLRGFDFEIASKTGTVGEKDGSNSDIWNLSYTPNNTMCVWFGSTNEKALDKKLTGGSTSTSCAREIYSAIKEEKKVFDKPRSILDVTLNKIEYDENKKLLLATNLTPDRYKFNAIFAKDNVPKEFSKIFDEIQNFDLTLEKSKENDVVLSLNANKYLTYDIYKKYKDTTCKLKTIKNKEGKTEIKDDDVKNGIYYTYYAVAKFLYQPTNEEISKQKKEFLPNNQSRESNHIKIFLTQKSPQIIHYLFN